MRIDLGGYILNSDPYCYWLTKKVKPKNGKQEEYEKRVTGYCSTLEEMFVDYIDKKVKSIDVATLKELSEEIEKVKLEVRDLCKGVINE